MGENRLYVFTYGEDGLQGELLTDDVLLHRVTPDRDGDTYYGGSYGVTFVDTLEKLLAAAERPRALFVLRYCPVMPTPKTTVTAWSL